jgi:hypothetical protein
MHGRPLPGTLRRATRFPGGLDLFRGPEVGLGKLYILFRARDLAFMPFQ